jgi:hypothetical protein
MAFRTTQEALLVSATSSGKVRTTQEALLISVTNSIMTLAYPLSPPAISGIGPEDFTMTELNVVGESDSPFDLSQELQQWQGQQLQIEANLPPMLAVQAEQWLAFLGGLFGKWGTCLMGDYNRPTPQGPMTGAPVAAGSNPSALNTINLRGANPSVTNWAVAGDYLQLQVSGFKQRIYKVLQNASSDIAGNITGLNIFPNVRETVPDGTPIIVTNCQGTFRLQDNSLVWKVDKNKVYSISFKMKEAIP